MTDGLDVYEFKRKRTGKPKIILASLTLAFPSQLQENHYDGNAI